MIFGLFTGTRQVCWCSQVLFFRQYSWSSANGNGYLRKVVCYLVVNACRNEKFSHGCESSFDCLKDLFAKRYQNESNPSSLLNKKDCLYCYYIFHSFFLRERN